MEAEVSPETLTYLLTYPISHPSDGEAKSGWQYILFVTHNPSAIPH
jgi:hypothetical protein